MSANISFTMSIPLNYGRPLFPAPGRDVITPEQVANVRAGIVYSKGQLAALAASLPSLSIRRWCKDNNYAIVPAPPKRMSTFEIVTLFGAEKYFANLVGCTAMTSFGWLAICKKPLEGSLQKDWSEQRKLLSALQWVPNVATMAWFTLVYFNVHQEKLFDATYTGKFVRTSSVGPHGKIYVGHFDTRNHEDGSEFAWGDDLGDHSLVGLAVARRLKRS